MSLLGWILIGLLAGGAARMLTGARKRGCLGTLVVGVAGAVIGGALFSLAIGRGLGDDVSWWSFFVAVVGATILLLVVEALAGRAGNPGRGSR